jgi:hypothetical protein
VGAGDVDDGEGVGVGAGLVGLGLGVGVGLGLGVGAGSGSGRLASTVAEGGLWFPAASIALTWTVVTSLSSLNQSTVAFSPSVLATSKPFSQTR